MKKDSGFTLMELAVVVAIIGVLSAITIPNVISWKNSAGVRAAARAVLADFQDAKMAAIKRASVASIVFDGAGYRVFVDVEDDGTDRELEFDDGDIEIEVRQWSNFGDVQIDTGKGGITFPNNDDGQPAIGFRSNGLPRTNNGGFGAGTVHLKNSSGKTTNSIVLSRVGSIRIDY